MDTDSGYLLGWGKSHLFRNSFPIIWDWIRD